MKKYTKEELIGKYVVAYDTLCDGNQCMMEDEEGKPDYAPMLFNSREEALMEIIDSACSKWDNSEPEDRREAGVKMADVKRLDKLFDNAMAESSINKSKNPKLKKLKSNKAFLKLEKFFDQHNELNDYNEWAEKAEEFIMNRKTFIWTEGGKLTGTITGKKLNEI